MKNHGMKITLLMVFIMIGVVITGTSAAKLSFRKVNADYTTGRLKEFVKRNETKNGVYLFHQNKRTLFLMLNEKRCQSKQKSLECVRNIKVEPVGNTLRISYNLEDHAALKPQKDINRLLYRIRLHKDFNDVKLYRNGKEISLSQEL